MPEAKSSGVRIDYTDAGKGEPALLLLPGWCATRAAFGKMAEICATHRRVLALDWRGHGASEISDKDFGSADLVKDALAVIEASRAQQVVPVALAHAGWLAIELRRRLGARISKIVLLDWVFIFDPPPHFMAALGALQDLQQWEHTRNRLFSTWLEGVSNPAVSQFVHHVMGGFGFSMWSRAGREIAAAYTRHNNPLHALEGFDTPAPVLHIYAQPVDAAYWDSQQFFAKSHPWFSAKRVNALSHFPMLETPEEIAEAIESFVTSK
jgi:pimeloyl-ACP methyl ester carboxylesterase